MKYSKETLTVSKHPTTAINHMNENQTPVN